MGFGCFRLVKGLVKGLLLAVLEARGGRTVWSWPFKFSFSKFLEFRATISAKFFVILAPDPGQIPVGYIYGELGTLERRGNFAESVLGGRRFWFLGNLKILFIFQISNFVSKIVKYCLKKAAWRGASGVLPSPNGLRVTRVSSGYGTYPGYRSIDPFCSPDASWGDDAVTSRALPSGGDLIGSLPCPYPILWFSVRVFVRPTL